MSLLIGARPASRATCLLVNWQIFGTEASKNSLDWADTDYGPRQRHLLTQDAVLANGESQTAAKSAIQRRVRLQNALVLCMIEAAGLGNDHFGQASMKGAKPGDVLAAYGYIFAATESLASLAGLTKNFLGCCHPVPGRIKGGLAASCFALAAMARTRQTPEAILPPKVITANDPDQGRAPGTALAMELAMA